MQCTSGLFVVTLLGARDLCNTRASSSAVHFECYVCIFFCSTLSRFILHVSLTSLPAAADHNGIAEALSWHSHSHTQTDFQVLTYKTLKTYTSMAGRFFASAMRIWTVVFSATWHDLRLTPRSIPAEAPCLLAKWRRLERSSADVAIVVFVIGSTLVSPV